MGTLPDTSPAPVVEPRPALGRGAVLDPAWLVWAAVTLGVLLRVFAYFANRSLWLDEAMLAVNVLAADARTLVTGPLQHHQGAPPVFLLLEKLAITLLGPTEYALRLPPLLFGCAALPIFAIVARRVLTPWPAALATALLALGPMPVYYAVEVKQYSADLFAAVLLLFLAVRTLAPGARPRDVFLLALVGAGLIWLSHASVFLLAGVGTALFVRAAMTPSPERLGRLALLVSVATLWLASFAGLYLLSLRALVADAYLADFWEKTGALLPFPPTTPGELAAYPRAFLRLARDLFAPPVGPFPAGEMSKVVGGLALALAALGAATFTHRRALLAMLLLPIGWALVASMLGKYPLFERLALFAHPLLILLATAGVAWLSTAFASRRASHAAAVVVAVALLGLPLHQAGQLLVLGPARDEIRGVLKDIAARPADQSAPAIYTLAGAQGPTTFYLATSLQPAYANTLVLHGPAEIWRPQYAGVSELDVLRRQYAQRRIWVVLSTTWHPLYARQEDSVRRQFDAAGTRLDEVHRPGASAYLYELRPAR